uniref:Uncharacterized protein n=1 Tax=viral metagenome TaxID=1070528 RepID=A0A6H1Z7E4_9ZZZZ
MIEEKPTAEATVSPGVPKLLQQGYYVRFTDAWPAEQSAVRGKTFQIAETNQITYDIFHIIPTNDYRDVDLSNSAGGEMIYPENINTLYEVVAGFKPGNYLAQIFIPAGEALSRLEAPSMNPSPTSATLRYLGQRTPTNCPYDDKRLFFYFVKNVEPLILRMLIDTGIDFEKFVIGLMINKCRLSQIATPTAEQLRLAKLIRYYSELRW